MADKLTLEQIRALTLEELQTEIEDNRYESYMLRLNKVSGELKNTNLLRANKRYLARLKTVQSERLRGTQQPKNEGK
ncbi:MAG: 50S ribosomal protein L29 [Anaerolineae bacterium]|jgi:ribosomal protein L29|nr:50S ribosomal protein L29 [Anaerolineae bacterium]